MTNKAIHVKLYAAAREAFGASEIFVEPTSVMSILSNLAENNPRLGQVLDRSSVLINGAQCHDYSRILVHGDGMDVLPPFAGG